MRRRPNITRRGDRWTAVVDVAPLGSPVREQRRVTGRTKAEVSRRSMRSSVRCMTTPTLPRAS
jgi:hypothetical protein